MYFLFSLIKKESRSTTLNYGGFYMYVQLEKELIASLLSENILALRQGEYKLRVYT